MRFRPNVFVWWEFNNLQTAAAEGIDQAEPFRW